MFPYLVTPPHHIAALIIKLCAKALYSTAVKAITLLSSPSLALTPSAPYLDKISDDLKQQNVKVKTERHGWFSKVACVSTSAETRPIYQPY
jgi:hypothetical protein